MKPIGWNNTNFYDKLLLLLLPTTITIVIIIIINAISNSSLGGGGGCETKTTIINVLILLTVSWCWWSQWWWWWWWMQFFKRRVWKKAPSSLNICLSLSAFFLANEIFFFFSKVSLSPLCKKVKQHSNWKKFIRIRDGHIFSIESRTILSKV